MSIPLCLSPGGAGEPEDHPEADDKDQNKERQP